MTKPLALVIGGSRGLGLLIARELLETGHQVVISARAAEDLDRAVSMLEPAGPVVGRQVDVRDRSAVEALVADVEDTMGPIDTVITVAGIISVAPADAQTYEHFEQAMDTMAWGPINVAMAVLPRMRERHSGHIGTVTSIGGVVSPPHLLPYSAAKFAAVGFSDGLAAALSGSGVTATTIIPGLMRTGSHERAEFGGDPSQEYGWFSVAASLPLLSADATRAARRIVRAVAAGKPVVTITPLAFLAIRARGLAPGTTTRLMGLVSRLLPDAPPGDDGATVPGATVDRRLRSRVWRAATTLGRRAARANNERRAGDS
jgi:NAD(P)-dependent dehydrogenase (short-subunit alcohol dehydrogenase family)